MVYERLHGPLGSPRDDYLAAMMAATTAAAFSSKPPPMSEFYPNWPEIFRDAEEVAGGDDS